MTPVLRNGLAAVAVIGLLSGCAAEQDLSTRSAQTRVHAKKAAKEHAKEHAKEARKASQESSLPPGDPGADASEYPDPGRPDEAPHHGKPHKKIPNGAMLDGPTVGSMIGGRWVVVPASSEECFTPGSSLGRRTVGFSSSGAAMAETVATYRSAEAAEKAYADVVGGLRDCGWTPGDDPRLGTASVQATREGQTATFVVNEGVTLLLAGSGRATKHPDTWAFLVDLALGNSCAAAPDGCH